MNEARTVFVTLVRGGWATLWPWLILAIAFGINLTFFSLVDDPTLSRQSGGLLSLFGTAVVANLQSWTRVLPFTLGLGGTRRGFISGMGAFVVAQSLVAAVSLAGLNLAESATGGWGQGMRFFRLGALDTMGSLARFVVLGAVFLAVNALGGVMGAALARWGSAGVWGLSLGGAVLVSATLLALAGRGQLGSLFDVLNHRSTLELWAGYPFGLTVVCAVGAWLLIRRAPLR